MVHFYASILLTFALLVLAVLHWRGNRTSQRPAAHQAQAGSQPTYYLLAHGIILLLAMIVPTPVSIAYKAAILLGLLLMFLATVTRSILRAPSTLVHAVDLVVVALYLVTFAAHHPLKWPTPWLLLLLLVGAGIYLFLRPYLAELQSTVLVYALLLLLLSWQVLEVVVVGPALWSWSALLGVLGFILVKTVLLINAHPLTAVVSPAPVATSRWRALRMRLERMSHRLAISVRLPWAAKGLALAVPLIILLYQWLLVLSIWGPALGQQIDYLP